MEDTSNCSDCKIDTFLGTENYYTVTDKLWQNFGYGNGMICLKCFKKRMGREFIKNDFPQLSINIIKNTFVRELNGLKILTTIEACHEEQLYLSYIDILIEAKDEIEIDGLNVSNEIKQCLKYYFNEE